MSLLKNTDLLRCEDRSRVAATSLIGPVSNSVSKVPLAGINPKVLETVVTFIAVVMANIHPLRDLTQKGQSNEAMDRLRLSLLSEMGSNMIVARDSI
jgi:hypothetical protein